MTDLNGGEGRPPLIATKIRVPRRHADLLRRQRLVDFVHANLDRKLILISAPAGFGKTSMLIEFAHDAEMPVCWLTLDPFDQDLRVFLEHFVAAIARRFPAFGRQSRAFLRQTKDPAQNLYALVATLVQEIYETIPEYFCLVLDDHHTVEDQDPIQEFLDLFLTYVDENCHLVVASRRLPALPNLSLLIARRQAIGLSLEELRFTPQEIEALARQNYGLALRPDEASRLAERTGGWITGLLLTVAHHWAQAPGAGERVPIRGRIDVGLFDYLSQQVLDRQPTPLRDFLLASSVLDELAPDLCAAVLELGQAAALMDEVRSRNLFVVEFEEDNRLRYHDLFRDFLRARLCREDTARYTRLTRRAAGAYAARGEWDRAVSRYLELEDYPAVADLVEQVAVPMYDGGRWDTLSRWIDALPESIRAAHPQFLVHRAKIYADRGDLASALDAYERAEQSLAAAGDEAEVARVLALRGYVLRYQGRYAEGLRAGRRALGLVGEDSTRRRFIQGLAFKNVGLCQLKLGHLAEGREALEGALRLYEQVGSPYDEAMVHQDLGWSYELGGELEQAIAHYHAALQRWQRLDTPGPWAHTLNNLGVVHYQRGEYPEAARLLDEALDKARQSGSVRVEAVTWASRGDLYRARGEYVRAEQAFDQALEVARRADEAWIITYALDAQGNILRLQGDRGKADERLREALALANAHDSAYEKGLCHVSLGILANTEGDPVAARRHLDQALDLLDAGGFRRDVARATFHRAQSAFLAGDQASARADLQRALELAGRLGFDDFFVVEGGEARPLLRHAAEEGLGVSGLLARIERRQAQVAARREPTIQPEPLPRLEIHALGLPWVEMDGEVVQWPVLQSRDLFFLLLQHPRGQRKEEIGEAFWPEYEPHRLSNIFRSTMYRLRRALFRESVVYKDETYRFNRESDYWFDVEAFERLLDRASREQAPVAQRIAWLEEAADLVQGDYLAGIYADWCAPERQRLRERHLAGLEALAELYTSQNRLSAAVELHHQVLERDPYREPVHRALMRCYLHLGDRAAAIRQYQTCAEILREELGLSPMPETEALYLRIIE